MMEHSVVKYRHEFKYLISNSQLQILKSRINALLPRDTHANKNGMYIIRSLYFDDYYNRCYYENENGYDPREKFRIRIYNNSLEKIVLECKRKEHGKTMKKACPLTIEQARILMNGQYLRNVAYQPELLQKLTLEMMTHQLHPVIIVEYDRIPYVYKDGNVRITFDLNISSSSSILNFLDENIPKRPVMPKELQLIEVKYDEFLPDFIYRALQIDNLKNTAYSKYYICRKFVLN